MSTYNEAKADILDVIQNMGEATSSEIGLVTQRTPENAAMLLLGYYRWGLLYRRKIEKGAYLYSISERGLDRLAWLNSFLS